jgi:hypothetical protein
MFITRFLIVFLEWGLVVSEELEMHRGIWILQSMPFMEVPELRLSTVRSRRLTGTLVIALAMAIGSGTPVAYSFVVPIAKAIPLSGHYIAEE